LLFDTQLLLWLAADASQRLSAEAIQLAADPANELVFSAASLWEIAIKRARGRSDFQVDPHVFRRNPLLNGYAEMPVTSEHAVGVADLPPLHRDPFDRILIAQSIVEGITLMTADPMVARYPGPVRRV
jgi:PIN domain nuclease of toxin-antitoxin system